MRHASSSPRIFPTSNDGLHASANRRDRRKEARRRPHAGRAREMTSVPTSDDITTQQRQHWGGAASGWERHADWFDRNMGETATWLCDAAAIHPGQHVLDVACGAGQPAMTIA